MNTNALNTTKAPTVAEEMSKFQGFTTNNGETVKPDSEQAREGASATLTTAERKAGAKIVGGEAETSNETSANKPAKVELTDDEATAALDAARAKLEDGEELTTEEEDEALAAALAEKRTKVGKAAGPNDRVKRAQEGRRRAEARAARAERSLATLEQRLAALEAGGGKAPLTTDAKGGKKDTSDKEPDPKDYELGEVDAKFIRDLTRWEVRQELAATSKNQETQQQTAEQARAAAEFTAKREAFEEAAFALYDDFQDVVLDTVGLPKTDPAAWPLSVTLRDLIMDSEQGPRIIYGLASDPKEARKIDKLTKAEQQRWFFKQEAKLEAEHASDEEEDDETDTGAGRQPERQAATRKVTQAPPPPKRNNGGSGNRTVSAATTDFRAFEAMANQPAKR